MHPTPSSRHAVLLLASTMLVASGCSTDAVAPTGPSPAGFSIVAGDGQTGEVRSPLFTRIAVKVSGANGVGVPDVPVAFVVTAGGGSVEADEVSTDSRGVATVAWTLGSLLGPNSQAVTATAAAIPATVLTFTATSTVSKGTTITPLSGDGQTGEVLNLLPDDPTVVVLDERGEPVEGAVVTWSVAGGRGEPMPVQSLTDAAGVASTTWRLGPTVGAGSQHLAAAVSSLIRTSLSASAVLTDGTVTLLAGNGQTIFPGYSVPVSPSVLVRTPGSAGVPVAGVEVLWEVTAGGGRLNSIAKMPTGTDGVSRGMWVLGGTLGAGGQQLQASLTPGLAGSPVLFTASAKSPPATITKVSGDMQTGTVGQPLSSPLVVLVRDAGGDPVAGATVSWQGDYDGWYDGSTVSPAVSLTDAEGLASTNMRLGPFAAPWPSYADARLSLGPSESVVVRFNAVALPGPAVHLAYPSGNAQTGVVGSTLGELLRVTATDQFYNAVPGVPIEWSVLVGGGSVSPVSALTDSLGQAAASWTLGSSFGVQVVTASSAGLLGSPTTFGATAIAGP